MKLLKLYFVDDEPIIIKGLLETYEWERMGFQIAGWARDGEQALSEIVELRPDVVLTDVRMKRMDGLTLIQRVNEVVSGIKFVVISAYRDFEYAQKACANGAVSYLLKPIDDLQLEKVMSQLYETCTEQKFRETNYSLWEKILLEDQDNFLGQMISKYLDDAVEEKEIEEFMMNLLKEDVSQHYFAAAAVGIDQVARVVNQKEYNMKQYLLESGIYKRIRELYRVWVKKTPEGIICFVIDMEADRKTEQIKKILAEFRAELQSEIISSLTVGDRGFSGMKATYQQAVKLYEIASEAGAGILLADPKKTVRVKAVYSLDVETLLLTAIRKNDQKQLKHAFEKYIYTLPDEEDAIKVFLRRTAVRAEYSIVDAQELTDAVKESFTAFYGMIEKANCTKLVNILYQLFCHIIEEKKNAQELTSDIYFRDYIPVAISYIHENLADENLSITSVSEHVYLNPVYFGRLFKSVMKISFKRYVQNQRIEKAKELLQEGDNNITNICSLVGIPNASYFSQIFKQYTGMLPSDYKKKE